jgi:glutathione synthase/RimK-type ligase-like ATP-grasp enzyme
VAYSKVLIISHDDDYHATNMCQWLKRHQLAEPVLFDLHYFPKQAAVIVENLSRFVLRLPGGETLNTDEIISVWWRRVSAFSFEEILDQHVIAFCDLNCRHVIEGFFEILGDRVVDPILRMRAADRKLYQLYLAKHCGLRIPNTCITNDPNVAFKFITTSSGPTIYKVFVGVGGLYSTTTIIEPGHISKLALIRHSPLIIQQFIEPGFDIRITVVGKELFPAKQISDKSEARADIRVDRHAKISAYVLPSEIDIGIRKLVTQLGLRYCAIDMRVSANGEHYFLEVNPSGQYLFVETATLQPITAALAQVLTNPTDRGNYMAE